MDRLCCLSMVMKGARIVEEELKTQIKILEVLSDTRDRIIAEQAVEITKLRIEIVKLKSTLRDVREISDFI